MAIQKLLLTGLNCSYYLLKEKRHDFSTAQDWIICTSFWSHFYHKGFKPVLCGKKRREYFEVVFLVTYMSEFKYKMQTCEEFRMANRYSLISSVPEKFRNPTNQVAPSKGLNRTAALAACL